MIHCGDHDLVHGLQYYDKEDKSKIDTICDLAESMSIPLNKAYVLFDLGISALNAKQGYHCIGSLKMNRIIYPKGIRIGISDFTDHIHKSNVHLVTVNSSRYWIYRYE